MQGFRTLGLAPSAIMVPGTMSSMAPLKPRAAIIIFLLNI
jgi:hypothetical protein